MYGKQALYFIGVYDVLEDKMLPHSHKYPFDTFIDFKPDRRNYSKIFNAYLDTSSQDNDHVKKRMLQFMGNCCSNIPPLKKIALVMGEPNSGKSTYGNIIKKIVGQANTESFHFEHLTRFSSYPFVGKMLGLSTDMSNKRVSESAASWLKKMTGGDTVLAEKKHGDGFSYVSKCRFIMASNYYPNFADKALEDRMLVIPLPKSLQEDEINRNLLEDIKNDMQAVLRQVMDELREFIIGRYEFEGGFKTAKEAEQSYRKYEAEYKKAYRAYHAASIKNLDLKEYLVFWMDEIYRARVENTTYMLASYVLYDLLFPNMEHGIRLRHMNAEYLDSLLEKASRSCASAGNKCRELLNAAMKDAAAEGFIHRNPVPDTKPYKRKKPKIVVLSKEKMKLFLEKASDSNWYLEILLGLFMGLRK